MERLTDLPNVGLVLAERLGAAGIVKPSVLRRVGSVEAVLCIRDVTPHDPPCANVLYALEGAIRGVRWHALSKPERAALWQRYKSRLQEQDGAK